MYDKAIAVLKIFMEHGYSAYIVGGYPRDNLLGIQTNDIDICTNAKPKDIMDIFDTDGVSDIKYGSIRVIYKNVKFDVNTFRKDIKYEDNRRPVKIKYITSLKKDLLRRDFTINCMCIDADGNLIDILKGKRDLDKRIIKTVGNPRYRLKEDALRILRAIRFASYLDFTIDNKTKYYIKKYASLLENLSGYRKRDELDKIFSSKGKEKGRELIINLGLYKYLGFHNLDKIVLCDDIIGIWSQLDDISGYPFSKIEMDNINKIREMLKGDINNYTIYKYGLYISSVVGSIKGINYKEINDIYKNLAIYSKGDIVISGNDIASILGKNTGRYLKDIIDDIEYKIVLGKIKNEYDELVNYIKEKYGDR